MMVLDVATGAQTRVGTGQRDGAPVWSPDGQWLAFTSFDDGKTRLRVVRADGTEARALTTASDSIRWPRWSPDNGRLVYAAGDAFTAKIAVYDVAANSETEWAGGKTGFLRPVWLDPATIVAVAVTGAPGAMLTDLVRVTPTESAPLFLELRSGPDKYVEWAVEPAPKGTLKAFESNDGGDREIFIVSDKLGMHDLSNHRAADWNPVWAPDGKWMAFESFRDGRRGIYRAFVDTARVFPLAVTPGADNWAPSWSSDGKRIVFVSDRDGDPEIYLTDAEGKRSVQRLTQHPGDDLAPAWRPVEKRK